MVGNLICVRLGAIYKPKKILKMTETKELRLGNYVDLIKVHKKYLEKKGVDVSLFKVSQINRHAIHINNKARVDVGILEPIPLTEKWILKLGFKYNSFTTFYELKDVQIENEDVGTFAFYYKTFKINSLKYIHELQNLFFALTREELKLKK